MDPSSESVEKAQPKSGRSSFVRLVPIAIVILVAVVAFAVISRPVPGQRTTSDTSVRMIVGSGAGEQAAKYPVALREGGDPAHEADHVMEPLQGVEGISTVTLDWANGVALIVEFDSDVITASDIAGIIASSGYLAAPAQ